MEISNPYAGIVDYSYFIIIIIISLSFAFWFLMLLLGFISSLPNFLGTKGLIFVVNIHTTVQLI